MPPVRVVVSVLRAARHAAVAALCLTGALLGAAPGRAADPKRPDEKKVCSAAYEQAQVLRQDGKLRASREQLLVCARSVCAAAAQHDCGTWIAEVEQSLPSVVLGAQDPSGHDLVEVRVSLDGQPWVQKLDGKAEFVDPGVHQLRFEASGLEAHAERVVILEGEKRRKLAVRFEATAGNPVAAPPASSAPPPIEAPAARPLTAPVYLFGGLTLVGLAGGIAFAAVASSGTSNLMSSPCAATRTCAPSDINKVETERLIRNVSFAVGGASLVAAGVFFFLRPTISVQASGTSSLGGLSLDLAPQRGGAVGLVGGTL